ncbi:MAG TPA: RNA polymerase sigma factor [Pseudonocardiaceae bacterium]|nr:RNA polymerase sigma factor [Pseudonocardiaceae bacterium]
MDRESEFRGLYDAHRAAVHAYFVGRTGDRWVAADLMQEVFLRAWQRLAELRGRSADGQRAWLFTVARNLSVDVHRHERSKADAVAALRREPAVVAPSAHTAVVAADRVAIVGDAIAALPEHQRVALALATSGLNSAEIATALGVPAGTVRYRLSDARKTLAGALAQYDGPEHGTEGS